jgi:hypothetical protein
MTVIKSDYGDSGKDKGSPRILRKGTDFHGFKGKA